MVLGDGEWGIYPHSNASRMVKNDRVVTQKATRMKQFDIRAVSNKQHSAVRTPFTLQGFEMLPQGMKPAAHASSAAPGMKSYEIPPSMRSAAGALAEHANHGAKSSAGCGCGGGCGPCGGAKASLKGAASGAGTGAVMRAPVAQRGFEMLHQGMNAGAEGRAQLGGQRAPRAYEIMPSAAVATRGLKSAGCGCGGKCGPCGSTITAQNPPFPAAYRGHDDVAWLDSELDGVLRDVSPLRPVDGVRVKRLLENPDTLRQAVRESQVLTGATRSDLISMFERVAPVLARQVPKLRKPLSLASWFFRAGPGVVNECDNLERVINEWERELNEAVGSGGNTLRDLYHQCMTDPPADFCEIIRQANNHCNSPESCNGTSAAARSCEGSLDVPRFVYCSTLSQPNVSGTATYPSTAALLGQGTASESNAYWRAVTAIAAARAEVARCRRSGNTSASGPADASQDAEDRFVICLILNTIIAVVVAIFVWRLAGGRLLGLIGGLILAAIFQRIVVALLCNQHLQHRYENAVAPSGVR